MLTTESQESRKLEGKQAGATGWIVKPFNPEQLVKALLSATDTTVVSTLSVGKR
jgi:DNA-binding response OmpR family regulator